MTNLSLQLPEQFSPKASGSHHAGSSFSWKSSCEWDVQTQPAEESVWHGLSQEGRCTGKGENLYLRMAQLRVSEPKKQGDEAAHVEECPCWALEHTLDEENIQAG